jgi:dipeptidyl aminopeptidase/acylaminoacyl peptidase
LAIPTRYAPKRAHVPYWWFLATAMAALIAIGPIAAAVLVSFGGGSVTRTAFASAPAGNYAVVVRPEDEVDVVVVVPADGSAEESEIARVPRLPGYTAYGAVSPDGLWVALVTADGGTQARPVAALVVVELETGEVSRLAEGVDYLQTPVWANDGTSIVVTRSAGEGPATDVDLVLVSLDGSGEEVAAEADGVLGAYPVAFDSEGRLVHVVIDGRGSVAYRAGEEVAALAPGISRDWRLSPDGSTLAFIETSTAGGVQYFARTVQLGAATSQAFSLAAAGDESLGVAWRPGDSEPTFGREPARSASEGSRALGAAGFDVPLAYSGDGSMLAVQHWTGGSFSDPGEGGLQLVAPGGERTPLDGVARFYGWAAR